MVRGKELLGAGLGLVSALIALFSFPDTYRYSSVRNNSGIV